MFGDFAPFFVWGFVFVDSLESGLLFDATLSIAIAGHLLSYAPVLAAAVKGCRWKVQCRCTDTRTLALQRALMSYETVLNVNERGSYFKTNNMLGCFPKAVANRLSKVTVPCLLATLWTSSGILCVAGGLHLV